MFWKLNQLLAHTNIPNDHRALSTSGRNPRAIRTKFDRIHIGHMTPILLDTVIQANIPQPDGRIIAATNYILAAKRMIVDTLHTSHVANTGEIVTLPSQIPTFDNSTFIRRVHDFIVIC